MQGELKAAIAAAVKKHFQLDLVPELTRPDEKFGDYSSNAALQVAAHLGKNPQEIAQVLAQELEGIDGIAKADVAGAGFINLKLTDEALYSAALKADGLPKPLEGQEVLVEFGDPNPFKEMHIGHLYSYVAGDSIAALLQAAGANIRRLSYHGDVGRQVAQAIWGMRQMEVTDEVTLGHAYAKGVHAYEQDPSAKTEIDVINQHVYEQDDTTVNELHQKGVRISFEHFDKILNSLSISNDRRYLESQTTPVGLELVKKNIGKVFSESQGAIVYEGEKAGLHTRVFITSKGLPTYETKDLGLAVLKDKDHPKAKRSIVITANEQSEYFKVMLAALSEIEPRLADKTTHLAHGFVNLSTGKMSSRTGDVYGAEDLIKEVEQAASQQFPDSSSNNQTAIAALKYDFLKSRLGGNITFDVKESVSLEGNSGPYLQYAYARAASILSKANSQGLNVQKVEFDVNERSLARKISEYPEAVEKAVNELMPHHICTYLYELAQSFNRFYEHSRIIGDERQTLRLNLVRSYADVLKNGLGLLNIEAPEHV
jgi:arginyl-tRNA synthetase